MPGKVKVKIISGRNLPVMDRSSDTTDAYVEMKLGGTTYKTDVCRKSLHPQWNSEWYRFEVDDSELQDEPLQIRLMDHDTYSANDAIGKVYLNLNPLLLPAAGQLVKYGYNSGDGNVNHDSSKNSVLSGWIPVYDTMHGIRGEVNIIVKVELFSDFNKFRQSSCGVQFYCSSTVPQGYFAQVIHGFVEELIVDDDPEYQWIDKIRTPRASNEARQTLFFKLSGELQRKIGVKALNLGGNAVIGYNQSFDLEGESGIVARGIGTAVSLVKAVDISHPPIAEVAREELALNYLKFIGYDKKFRLSANPNNCNLLIPFPNPLDLNYPELVDRNINSPRHFTSPVQNKLRAAQSNPSLTKHVSHTSSLKTLLKQEDKRGTPGYGFSQRIKNLKYSSQSSLSKKMTALKAKLGDTGIGEEIGGDVEAVGFRKRNIFQRTNSDSSVMAELLARSVINVHNSLSSILEVQNASPPPPPLDDESETLDKLQPIAQLLNKTVSEPSSESYSSSDSSSSEFEDDFDDEDEEAMNNRKDNNMEFDTISNIICNVEMIERDKCKEKLPKQYSLPSFPVRDFTSTKSLMNIQFDEENNFNFPRAPLYDSKLSLYESINAEFQARARNIDLEEEPEDLPSETDMDEELNPTDFLETDDQTENLPMEQVVKSHDNVKKAEDEINVPSTSKKQSAKPISLINTAMQTMLLERANLMGTPPTSPVHSPDKLVSTPPLISNISTPTTKLVKCPTSVNISDYSRRHETVLGVPFTAITSSVLKRQQSHPCLSSVTSNESVERLIEKDQNKSGSELKSLSRSHDSSLDDTHKHKRKFSLFKPKTHENGKKKFHFFHPHDSRLSDDDEHHSHHSHKNIFSRIFHKHSKEELVEKNLNENEPKPIPNPNTASIQSDLANQAAPLPVNIEIAQGINSNNQLACLTSLRNHTPPATENVQNGRRQSPEPVKLAQSPVNMKLNAVPSARRSSDSDLSITPKGNSLTGSDRSGGVSGGYLMRKHFGLRSAVHQENFDMLEYPFLTMSKFSPGFILQLGGAVSARSVKLLERISNVEEPESRDTWWSEIRMEIRSHARSLNCNAVLGYTESTSICEDVCVLSASGTAAVIGFHYGDEMEDGIGGLPVIGKSHNINHKDIMTTSLDRNNFEKDKNPQKTHEAANNCNRTLFESPEHVINPVNSNNSACKISHLPFDTNNVPVRATVTKCNLCSKAKVPDVLLATIEPPDGIPSTGRGCFLESFICRPLKDLKGESIAKDISDGLPFLEYELHRLLVNKLKIKGMNAIFGLKIRISIGEKMLIGIGTGTAIFLASLPSPVLPRLVSDKTSDEKKLADLQKSLQETIEKNRETYKLKSVEDFQNIPAVLSDDESGDEQTADLLTGNKDCCILEVDDPQDAEVVNLLMEERPPDGFHVVNTESVAGLEDLEIVKNLQMFTQIYRAKLTPPFNINKHFRRLLQSVYFKLRRMVPCALCDLQFRVDLPEPDEIQLCVIGMALGLGKKVKKSKTIPLVAKRNEDDMIFKLDEDNIPENGVPTNSQSQGSFKQKSPFINRPQSLKQRHIPYKERHGVDITPLSYVPGGKIERYLGNLNFFFIRETTSIREEGGLSGFIHSFITEVLAIVRAHVTALGGNAMVAYFLTECVLNHNLHKNQGQCLINVGGDVVFVSYFKEEP